MITGYEFWPSLQDAIPNLPAETVSLTIRISSPIEPVMVEATFHPSAEAGASTPKSVEMAQYALVPWGVTLPAAEREELIDQLAEALGKAHAKFAEYAELHFAKGTPEGAEKALANHTMASICRNAMAKVGARA